MLELKEFLAATPPQSRQNCFVVGRGSNSLLSDRAWPGLVISLRRLNSLRRVSATHVECGAGVENSELTRYCRDQGLSGVAWMHCLPGFVGGTVRMNARCYGGEISGVVRKIIGLDSLARQVVWHSRPDTAAVFRGYKDTIFMDKDYIITGVKFELTPSSPAQISERMRYCKEDRMSKGHFDYPSCGCVFKNDYRSQVSVPSGILIELAGAKGMTKGGAEVSNKHANFIYNTGSATSSDILELSFAVRDRVWQDFGVWLRYEMEVLGSLSKEHRRELTALRPEGFKVARLAAARSEFLSRRSFTSS